MSVVLPVVNESASLPRFMEDLQTYIESNFPGERVEIIIINNGSTDDTSRVATRLLSGFNGGNIGGIYREFSWKDYSEAVRQAVLMASGESIVWLGVDIADIACIGRGMKVMKETDADVVLLSKYKGADWRPARRIIINRAYNFLVRALDGLWFSDAEGYMMISNKVRPLFNSLGFSRGNTLNLNLLYFCKRLGLRIEEAPFYVAERRKSVFLMSLPLIMWSDLKAILAVHERFKRFAELRSHPNRSVHQS